MQFDSENASDAQLLSGVRNGQRRALAKAITLVESTLPAHRARAQALINEITSARNSPVGADETTAKEETTALQGGRAQDALCAVADGDTPSA